MHLEFFYDLYKKIKKQLWIECKYNNKRKHAPNGCMYPIVRLACALRMFAGGECVDIACTYGLSKTEVYDSFDYVIAAVNSHPDLKIEESISNQCVITKKIFKHFQSAPSLLLRIYCIRSVTISFDT